MKWIALACVSLMVVAASAHADPLEDFNRSKQRLLDMHCAAEEELAASIMMLRQLGAPMATALGENPTDRQRAFVMEAYEAPREKGKASQLRAAEEFGNQAALACHKREADGPKD